SDGLGDAAADRTRLSLARVAALLRAARADHGPFQPHVAHLGRRCLLVPARRFAHGGMAGEGATTLSEDGGGIKGRRGHHRPSSAAALMKQRAKSPRSAGAGALVTVLVVGSCLVGAYPLTVREAHAQQPRSCAMDP